MIRVFTISTTARLIVLGALAAVLATAPAVAAADVVNVAGKYEGFVRGSSEGDLPTSVSITQDGAKISGTMDAGSGRFVFTISGTVEGAKVSWDFSSSEVGGSATATYQDGAINGSWAAMGQAGSLELKRTAGK